MRRAVFATFLIAVFAYGSFTWRSGATAAPTRMLRQPAVSAERLAFMYAGNIWTVGRAGGMAQRITSFPGGASNPKFSPDGRWLAFSAAYGGNTDVYVVPAEGGEPKRLTWHPGADTVQGWTPDGRSVLFASGRATWAPSAAPRFWTVPAEGGVEQPLPIPRGYQGKISPDGTRIAYRLNTSWDEERRNYRGGQNRPVWIVDLKTFDLISPPWTDSKDVDPVWIGDTVYFISDREGIANVWAFDSRARRLRQVTRFTDYDVKTIDTGAGALVVEQAGVIHTVDPSSGRATALNITATGDFPWMMAGWEDVSSRLANMAISPTGRRVVVEARGEIFTIPVEKGDIRNLTQTSHAAERDPAWSPDGRYISYFSDKSGEYRLMLAEPEGINAPREIVLPKPTRYYTASWSPDSKKLLYSDANVNVWVLDVASGQSKIVGRDPWMVPERTLNPVWSPDSKWVAYAGRLQSLHHAIFVANAETGESKQITDGLADAVWPAWDANGKYLWFLASTNYGLASQWLDMTSYEREQTFGLYFAILRKGEPTPFVPESDEDPGLRPGGQGRTGGAPRGGGAGPGGAGQAAAGQAGTGDAQPPPRPAVPVTVQIDFDNMQRRILAVPGVPTRNYSRLRSGGPGIVYYVETPAGGGQSTLHRYRLSERRAAPFATGVTDYVVSADTHKMLYRGGGGGGGRGAGAGGGAAAGPALFIVDADRNPPQAGAGRLTVSLRMYLDRKAEYKQIFREGWRLQRDYLYVPNMHGADWTKMEEMYGELLPHINHRADLNYLLDNMGAEIAVGHSYVRGGDMPDVPETGGGAGGLLGADFAVENGRYRITRIYDTEVWNPELRAPLTEPGVDVNVGDYVLAINNVELRAPDNIHRLLDGTANRQTRLTVNGKPAPEGARQVTVVPVTN